MIIYLINKYPQHFPDSPKEEVIKYGPFAVEDVYRAYCLLRQAWAQHNASDAKKTQERSDPAITPTFLIYADLNRLSGGGKEAGLMISVDKDNPEPA
jgi:hypothetical protein